ncbi:hypothetical protein F9Z84_06890 [Escherichia coli]|nr:hypothetical protein F9Z84_06890 [Escherichia coli]
MVIPNEVKLSEEFDLLDWAYDGYASLLNGSKEQFDAMTGNESYYALHFDANQYAGTENKFTDGIKKAAQTLYTNITNMLKRINEYFFGEGQKAAENAAENASEALDALGEVDGNTPIPEDSSVRDPEALATALQGGTEFNEVKDENSELGSAIDKVMTAVNKVKDCDTVAKLRAVYDEIRKAADSGVQAVSQSLRSTLSEANSAASDLRNPKLPKDDDTAEVKAGIKQENQEAVEKAKEETKKARIIGGVRNKFVAVYNSLAKQSKTIKEQPAKSEFKG